MLSGDNSIFLLLGTIFLLMMMVLFVIRQIEKINESVSDLISKKLLDFTKNQNASLEQFREELKSQIQITKPYNSEKRKGANRRPRTEEEKLNMALKKKEWWEKRKAKGTQDTVTGERPPVA